jgi:hypothetical protein
MIVEAGFGNRIGSEFFFKKREMANLLLELWQLCNIVTVSIK